MPTYTEEQLAAGYISKATIQASQTYSIESFALQSDQNLGRRWTVQDDRDSTFPTPARIARTADGNSKPDGPYSWHDTFAFMTEGQLAYLDTLLGWSDTVWSATCTRQTMNRAGSYDTFQAIAHRPQNLERSDRGYENVVIEYTAGVKL